MSPRWLLTAALGAAIASPLARDAKWDDFPISSFPMFSRGDLGTRLSLGHVVLVGRDGVRRPAPPSLVGSPEPMVAKNLVESAIAEDRARTLCGSIAVRAPRDVATVEVVSSVFDTTRYFADPTPIERHVIASCDVSR
jgi:hypothetical protein